MNNFNHVLISAYGAEASVELLPAAVHKIDWDNIAWQTPRRVFIGDMSNVQTGKDEHRQETIDAARILLDHNMTPVPHIAARRVIGKPQLEDIVSRMKDIGVQDVLIMAGSIKTPRGPFVSSREMMETGLLDEFRSVAFAAHPEGNPVAKDYETGSAITWKNRYAREHEDVDVSLITQLSFNAENVLRWAERTRLEGNKLPIHVGMAGPASLFEKFDYARKCGMGSAFKVAKAQGLNIVSFFKTVPSEMIREIVEVGGKDTFGKPLVQGLHFYTFNRVSRTVDFLHRMGEGAFREKGRGFVMEPG